MNRGFCSICNRALEVFDGMIYSSDDSKSSDECYVFS